LGNPSVDLAIHHDKSRAVRAFTLSAIAGAVLLPQRMLAQNLKNESLELDALVLSKRQTK
jgi:hypothetical protein